MLAPEICKRIVFHLKTNEVSSAAFAHLVIYVDVPAGNGCQEGRRDDLVLCKDVRKSRCAKNHCRERIQPADTI